ncbi:MAG: DNA cytosine methyltransferase [Planctomycetes bacterium]|nr:DNA cytosine methyltransferase [Planctomycetota bacterium]
MKTLNDLGYACDAVMLDAVHFVPQSRPRLFVIASRGSSLRAVRALEPASRLRPPAVERFMRTNRDLGWGRVDLPPPPTRRLTLADIVEVESGDSPLWWSAERTGHLVQTMRPLDRARAESLRRATSPTVGTVYRRTRYGKAVAELRVDGVAGCLRTARGGSSKQFVVAGGNGTLRARNMTPRECARLQGAPDSFRLDVPVNQALFGFGDAVCVPAVSWLVSHAFPAARRQMA